MPEEKVTLKEIAQRTGVSLGTVHRAIYGKSGVSEKTREMILNEVRKSKYQIDEAASVLKRHAQRVLVVMPKAEKDDRFYFRGLWNEIKQTAKNMGQYKIYFQYVESSYSLHEIWRELERVYDEVLDEIDGLITVADGEKASIWISRFAKRGISTVLLSSYYIGDNPLVRCIKVDHVRCGQLAAEFMGYVLNKEKGKILVLSGDSQVYSNRVYAKSFEETMTAKGFELVRVEGFGRSQIEADTVRCLKQENIQGIFAGNARNTYSICHILEENNMGEQILFVGTDVFEELRDYFDNGILNATIYQSQGEQGIKAVHKMHDYLGGGTNIPEDEILPPTLLLKSNYDCFL